MFEKLDLIWQKLKREWKTFVLSVSLTVAGAWELAATWGADLPSLFSWVPEEYKSGVLFLVGFAFLVLRKYTPTTVVQKED
jgi:hypothetical protein